jgi:hypothetical protein
MKNTIQIGHRDATYSVVYWVLIQSAGPSTIMKRTEEIREINGKALPASPRVGERTGLGCSCTVRLSESYVNMRAILILIHPRSIVSPS